MSCRRDVLPYSGRVLRWWVIPIVSCCACHAWSERPVTHVSSPTTAQYQAASGVDREPTTTTTMSLFEQPREQPAPPPPEPPKVEREPVREPVVEPPPARRASISDSVSQQVMATGQQAFLACYRRALKMNPLLGSVKIHIEVDVAPTGAVTTVRTDAEDQRLSACFGRVVMQLQFPAPDAPAQAKLVFIASS